MGHTRRDPTGHPPGRARGAYVEAIGPEGLVTAVLRQAVKDARAGIVEAAVWLHTWGELWAGAAGLDHAHAWANVLNAQGIRHTGADYMPGRDHPDVTTVIQEAKPPRRPSGRPTGRPRTRPAPARIGVRLIVLNDATMRAVITDLRQALTACDGDLAAALGELRGTPAGDRLQAWLLGEL